MATKITDDCINCGACEPECPNTAITAGESIYVINPDLCSECVGQHEAMACAEVCPVDCCLPDPGRVETEDALFAKSKKLHPDKELNPALSHFKKK
jgi:ferredoxin